jgi:hypothetical protein
MIVVFGLLTTAASNVFSNVYHVYQAEIFPSDVRATAVGWTYSVSRLSSAHCRHLIPVLNHFGATTMFAVVLVALAATIAVLAPIGPRTAGRSLDEINRCDRAHPHTASCRSPRLGGRTISCRGPRDR